MKHLCGGKITPIDMLEIEKFGSFPRIKHERMFLGDCDERATAYAAMAVYGNIYCE